jgi:hypothetical protein
MDAFVDKDEISSNQRKAKQKPGIRIQKTTV